MQQQPKPKFQYCSRQNTEVKDRPLANLKVEIYDVGMREWQALVDTLTNKDGKYELKWTHDQLSSRGKKRLILL